MEKENFCSGVSKSSFLGLSKEEIEVHLKIKKYGDFMLTNGISPSYDLKVVPRAGFQERWYIPCNPDRSLALIISASKESLFSLFVDLSSLLSSVVAVILETSHNRKTKNHYRRFDRRHRDTIIEEFDLPVLLSALWDFEELLTDDGCTGIGLIDPEKRVELLFDEHKLLLFYNWQMLKREILAVLAEYKIAQIPKEEKRCFVTDAEHIHESSEAFVQRFKELKVRLGAD